MHVPSWYRNWKERRRTAQITNGLPSLHLSHAVNASVTVMGGSDVASTITKFERTPLGGSSQELRLATLTHNHKHLLKLSTQQLLLQSRLLPTLQRPHLLASPLSLLRLCEPMIGLAMSSR